jgi:hypothetical protein
MAKKATTIEFTMKPQKTPLEDRRPSKGVIYVKEAAADMHRVGAEPATHK